MTDHRYPHWRRLLFLPPLIIGIGTVAYAVSTRQQPERAPPQERAASVRVITAPQLLVIPRAVGFGTVQPKRTWSAVAQVGGKVASLHPRLRKGEILPAGTTLLQIDPTDYALAVTRIEAERRATEARLAELDARVENLRRSRDIEARSLDLSRADLDRKMALLQRGNLAQATVDEQERAVLASELRVQNLANELNLVPAQRAVAEAELALRAAQLDAAQLDLDRTVIRAPFDLRIAEANVEQTQFVRQGEVLAEADGIAVSEIAAQFALDKAARLIPTSVELNQLTAQELGELPPRLGLRASVHLRFGDQTTSWQARVTRTSDTVDPRTRTLGIIVAVDEPYRQAIPGQRPPLTKGMYVEVELRGQAKPDTVVVPRAALHRAADGGVIVYVADAENRLRFRRIEIGFAQQEFVTVAAGLSPGEYVVLSDLVPALDGMLLDPVADREAAVKLEVEATSMTLSAEDLANRGGAP